MQSIDAQPHSGLKHQSSMVETDGNQYNGVSGLYQRKKSVKGSDFAERFQGRNSLMNKEGHIGIVKNTNQPIKKVDKVELNQELI